MDEHDNWATLYIHTYQVTEENTMVSFDFESLFTNVPVRHSGVTRQLFVPKGFPERLVLELKELKEGAAVESPLSHVTANIFI